MSNITKPNEREDMEEQALEADKCFKSLEKKVKQLVQFILEKKNLHAELKTMARRANSTIDEYAKLRSAGGTKENADKTAKDKETQPSPEPEKKRKKRDPNSPIESPVVKKPRKGKKTPADEAETTEQEIRASKPGTEEWAEAKRRATKKKKNMEQHNDDRRRGKITESEHRKTSRRKPRPEAIKIKALDGTSYADILRKVKAAPNMKEIGERVMRIRRTRAGELLLELEKPGTASPNIEETVLAILQKSAEVQLMTDKETLRIKDMDETTTPEEVIEAVAAVIGPEAAASSSIKIRGLYNGTQAAHIQLPVAAARKLLENGKLRIGWVNCRVQPFTPTQRCYRCLENGHIAKDCKSDEDRSKQCFRCRKEGHKAADSAQDLLHQLVREERADIVIVSEKYRDLDEPNWVKDATGRAAVWVCGHLHVSARMIDPTSNFTWIEVAGMRIYSCYLPPSEEISEFKKSLDDIVTSAMTSRLPVVIAGDFNAWAVNWGSARTNARGHALLEAFGVLELEIANRGTIPTYSKAGKSSIVDVTFIDAKLLTEELNWRVSDRYTGSDHQAITYRLQLTKPSVSIRTTENKRRWAPNTFDRESFLYSLEGTSVSGTAEEKRRVSHVL
ncbi:uncharacterized protein LOC131668675 [Phymastichus coffea]|uniref:uncharacterized protein LOC131668675 n=1 Tax=Phymastichus coffea TaxID=108790 RepID=UPI00273AD75D|nr:uncharacterized protein LOC131668675 [Phymastichus coffea]